MGRDWWRGTWLAAALLIAASASAQTAATLAGMNAYNSGDFATAYRLLSAEADAGDAEAQVNLGYLYARGQGVATDQMQAFLLYARSAEQGNSEGMNAVGYKYQFGTGVKDIAKAIDWYCRAVALGNARAMNNLAIILHDGRDLPRDEAEARNLWLQSANLDHYNAMYNLGASYLRGDGAPVDRAQGAVWMLRAAQSGHAAAQTWLRQSGYSGTLPQAADWGAMMVPAGRHTAGHTKVCGTPVS
jgi:TPR repeat protein